MIIKEEVLTLGRFLIVLINPDIDIDIKASIKERENV